MTAITMPGAMRRRSLPGPRDRASLTFRGRRVLVAVIAVMCVGAAYLVTQLVADVAARDATSRVSAVGEQVASATVVVEPGDTLWSIARRTAPGSDPRVTVARLRSLNDVTDGIIRPGDRLVLTESSVR